MSYQYVYTMQGVSKTYPGGRTVIKDISLSFLPGAKIGVIGHNGAGKSTLLRIMAGWDKEFSGEAWPAKGAKVGYLPQEPQLDASKNVLDNIMEAVADKKAIIDKFNEISMRFAEEMTDDEMNNLIAEQGELQEQIDALNLWDLEREIDIAMDALRCPEKDADVTKLSGGERRRVALCRLLLEQPDMLLLDEPTNHLDAESVAWLENHLKSYKGCVILVTHDRYFLDNITEWILELDRGIGVPWKGSYASWLEQKEARLANEDKEESSRQKQLQRELEWIRQSPKARQSKSKARIKAFEELSNKKREALYGKAQIVIPKPPKLGQRVIDASHISKGFGDRMLVDDFSFSVPPGAIVGIIGPNGAGKTTFFRMLTGQEKPDSGSITFGDSVKLGYIDQSRDSLTDSKNVWEEISNGDEVIDLGDGQVNSRAYVSSFNFKGADQQKKVGQLSGGERNRVHLAKMLREGANVLLLDEPTNDLDVDTLRALEDAIMEFAGCVMVISHDRWFLDRIATHIIAFEGDSHVEYFEGNFADYEEDKKRRLGEDALTPKRIKYKPLKRAA